MSLNAIRDDFRIVDHGRDRAGRRIAPRRERRAPSEYSLIGIIAQRGTYPSKAI